jgi:hypothetical protein
MYSKYLSFFKGDRKMRYAGMIKNDIAAGEGVNVSFFT